MDNEAVARGVERRGRKAWKNGTHAFCSVKLEVHPVLIWKQIALEPRSFFRNNGNVKLTATGNWHKCRPRLALFIRGKLFPVPVFSPLSLSFFLFFCSYHPLFIFLLPLPSPLAASSSSLTTLFHLQSRVLHFSSLLPLRPSRFVRSFVRSFVLLSCLNSFCLLSPPFLLSPFILCLSLAFSFCSQRSLCPSLCLSVSVFLSPVHLHTVPATFLLFPLFSSSFFFPLVSFLFPVCARSCVHVSSMHFARETLPPPPASCYYRRCARWWTPFGEWTVLIFDPASIVIPGAILERASLGTLEI